MFDFRLQVFHTVATRLSFTKAANELYITQPAVTRHIRELESHFKSSLFERSGNSKVILTPAGKMLLKHTEQLLKDYRQLEYDMNLLNEAHTGVLRIGASTTVAPYIIPRILAAFHQNYNQVKVNLLTGNTEQVEQAILNGEIQLGVVEGRTRSPQIRYQEYMRDELVLVCSATNTVVKGDTIKPADLLKYPLVIREPGSGTLEVIDHALRAHGIKIGDLNVEMQLGSTESIKLYMLQSDCLAFISIHAIAKELKNQECRIVDVKGLTVERMLFIIQQQGQPEPLTELLLRFMVKFKF
jgi:DNA-binding transcriptional LysR family regulator